MHKTCQCQTAYRSWWEDLSRYCLLPLQYFDIQCSRWVPTAEENGATTNETEVLSHQDIEEFYALPAECLHSPHFCSAPRTPGTTLSTNNHSISYNIESIFEKRISPASNLIAANKPVSISIIHLPHFALTNATNVTVAHSIKWRFD